MTPRVCGRQVSTPTPARTTCSPTRTDRLQEGDKCKTGKCRSEFLSALAWPLQASDSAYFKGKAAAVLSHRLARAGSTGGDNIRRPLARPISSDKNPIRTSLAGGLHDSTRCNSFGKQSFQGVYPGTTTSVSPPLPSALTARSCRSCHGAIADPPTKSPQKTG